jgi:hypothetical protein
MTSKLEARIALLEDAAIVRDERLAALGAEIDDLRQQLGRLVVTSKTAAIMDARTKPMSPEMAATGRSKRPEEFDSQSALINSRAGTRQQSVPGPIRYGEVKR